MQLNKMIFIDLENLQNNTIDFIDFPNACADYQQHELLQVSWKQSRPSLRIVKHTPTYILYYSKIYIYVRCVNTQGYWKDTRMFENGVYKGPEIFEGYETYNLDIGKEYTSNFILNWIRDICSLFNSIYMKYSAYYIRKQ